MASAATGYACASWATMGQPARRACVARTIALGMVFASVKSAFATLAGRDPTARRQQQLAWRFSVTHAQKVAQETAFATTDVAPASRALWVYSASSTSAVPLGRLLPARVMAYARAACAIAIPAIAAADARPPNRARRIAPRMACAVLANAIATRGTRGRPAMCRCNAPTTALDTVAASTACVPASQAGRATPANTRRLALMTA